MSRMENMRQQRLKRRFISYRVYGLILFCLIMLIGISWSETLSPSVRSAENDGVGQQKDASNSSLVNLPSDSTNTAPVPIDKTFSNSTTDLSPASVPAPVPVIAPAPVPAALGSEALVSATENTAGVEFNPPYIPVLNYHSITIDPGNRAVITPAKFEAQMNYLAMNGYKPLSLQQFIDYMDNKATGMPEKPILLTFDDGYADNYEHALPILKKLQFHATLFISPGTTEDGYFLNWEQIKEMHQAGWDIQPHGMTHPHLPKLTAKDQAYEITEAKRQIDEQLDIKTHVFCYPYGERNATTLKLLKDNGFRYAFTIDQGMTTRDQQPLLLKRIFVNGEETIDQWISRLEKKASNSKK
jgi:peptidoglycan/xylan/chitin deacetylase (PgdA/CDA1 family)